MKIQELENLFLKKYPEGSITKQGKDFLVEFNQKSKLYTYKGYTYQSIITKLELTDKKVIYKHDFENYKKQLDDYKKQLKNPEESMFYGFCDNTEAEKIATAEIEKIENILNNCIMI